MRTWWTIGLSGLAACVPSPPEGVLVCAADIECPEDWSCRRDRTCWRTADVDAGAEPFDAGRDDAGGDAGFDASRDAGCTIHEETYEVEADAFASTTQRTQAFGATREMNVDAGAMLLQFTADVDLGYAVRVTLRLPGLVCSDGCDPGHLCNVGGFRVPGTLELYTLATRFDEATVTTEVSGEGTSWEIDRGERDRGPLVASAAFAADTAQLDFVTDDIAVLTAAATFAFLVDRAEASTVFVARTREAGMPDPACDAETPAAQLVVQRCVE